MIKPRTLWCGFEDRDLDALVELTHRVAAGIDEPVAPRAWYPHITLARAPRSARPETLRALREAVFPWMSKGSRLAEPRPFLVDLPPLDVREVHLYESRTLHTGAEHRCIGTAPLAG